MDSSAFELDFVTIRKYGGRFYLCWVKIACLSHSVADFQSRFQAFFGAFQHVLLHESTLLRISEGDLVQEDSSCLESDEGKERIGIDCILRLV